MVLVVFFSFRKGIQIRGKAPPKWHQQTEANPGGTRDGKPKPKSVKPLKNVCVVKTLCVAKTQAHCLECLCRQDTGTVPRILSRRLRHVFTARITPSFTTCVRFTTCASFTTRVRLPLRGGLKPKLEESFSGLFLVSAVRVSRIFLNAA